MGDDKTVPSTEGVIRATAKLGAEIKRDLESEEEAGNVDDLFAEGEAFGEE